MSLSGMSHSGPWTDCRSTIVVLSQYSVHAQYCVAHQLVALLTLRVEAYSRGTASWRARSPLTAALQFSTHHLGSFSRSVVPSGRATLHNGKIGGIIEPQGDPKNSLKSGEER